MLLNLSASPFAVGKQDVREQMLASLARKHGVLVVYVNQVGGNDDLLFDGRSVVITPDGRLRARAKAFEPDVLAVDLEDRRRRRRTRTRRPGTRRSRRSRSRRKKRSSARS